MAAKPRKKTAVVNLTDGYEHRSIGNGFTECWLKSNPNHKVQMTLGVFGQLVGLCKAFKIPIVDVTPINRNTNPKAGEAAGA